MDPPSETHEHSDRNEPENEKNDEDKCPSEERENEKTDVDECPSEDLLDPPAENRKHSDRDITLTAKTNLDECPSEDPLDTPIKTGEQSDRGTTNAISITVDRPESPSWITVPIDQDIPEHIRDIPEHIPDSPLEAREPNGTSISEAATISPDLLETHLETGEPSDQVKLDSDTATAEQDPHEDSQESLSPKYAEHVIQYTDIIELEAIFSVLSIRDSGTEIETKDKICPMDWVVTSQSSPWSDHDTPQNGNLIMHSVRITLLKMDGCVCYATPRPKSGA